MAASNLPPNNGLPDFGTDIDIIPDLDQSWTLQTGFHVLGQAIARRLQTPRGALWAYPNYGIDIRRFLNDVSTDTNIAFWRGQIQNEIEQDERVLGAQVTLTYDTPSKSLVMKAVIDTAAGPFPLTLSISKLTPSVLSISNPGQ